MSFPNTVNITQAPGVEGDFASVNPRHSALSVEAGFVAGASGVTVGRFAWAAADANGAIRVLSNAGSGVPTGFVHRNMNALITIYLAESTMLIPAGFGVGDLYDGGDFWVKSVGAAAVTVGMKAFASNTTGAVTFAATGATVAGSTETKWYAATTGAQNELIKMTSNPPG